ncbi:MAG: alpha/beta hydrolase [Chloroflexi bacterium]|nr:alpha/beta hydrolase [Chloroflexota bacterium]
MKVLIASVVVPSDAKAGDLTMKPCTIQTRAGEISAECGTLVVPENRSKADSRLIAVPVVRLRAADANPAEPIFWLTGGPGQSNLTYEPPKGLLSRHDFVLVGYRGVDGSVKLDCPEVNRALKGVNNDTLSAESRANLGRALNESARRLQAESIDLSGYTAQEVVEDMEAARAGLYYERVNLYSASYGTRVAQIYAYLHPDRIYRSAMVGVAPSGGFVWEPASVDAQLEKLAQLWAQNASRRARTADLAETMRRVTHHMPRRWLFFTIDPGKVRCVSFVMLYERKTAAMIFDAYTAADHGDPSGLALMSLASDFVLPNLCAWGDFYAKISTDYDAARNYPAELDPPDSILGSPVELALLGAFSESRDWPIQLLPAELRQVQPSAVETLLVSGSFDAAAPAEAVTQDLLPALSHGKHVILSEMGHAPDLMSLQPQAYERLLTSFYDSGVADDSLYTYLPMDFNVPLGFPAMAKIMLGTILLVISVLVWLIIQWGR